MLNVDDCEGIIPAVGGDMQENAIALKESNERTMTAEEILETVIEIKAMSQGWMDVSGVFEER